MIANRTRSKILLFSAAALLAGATVFAQMQPGGMGQQPPMPGHDPSQQPGAQPGQPSYGGPGMNPGNSPSMADQAFVKSVMESDAAEVQLGQLATTKSQSDDVKKFGESMVENRKRLDDQLKPIAKELGVSEPKGPSKKDKQLIASLEGMSGTQFDEEYIRAVMKDHQKDVKDFQSAAQTAQDPNVQQTARTDAPVLEQHLHAIEQIAQAHNVQADQKK